MTVDKRGHIRQSEDVTKCTELDIRRARPASRNPNTNEVNVDAPDARVSTGSEGTHVQTPLADVKVGKDGGVSIKVPFFDLKIP